jgi:hypothetical protein
MRTIAVVIGSLLALGGCAPSYLPGINGSSYPGAAPLAQQERRSYVGLDASRGEGNLEGESSTMVRASYTIARGGEQWRGSFGGFVYGGSYDLGPNADSAGATRSFYGIGPFIDLSASLPFGAAHVGAGLHGGLALVELGSYVDFRKSRGNPVAMYLAPHSAIYLFAQYDLSERSSVALQAMYGISGSATANAIWHMDDFGFWIGAWSFVAEQEPLRSIRPGFSAGVSYRVE